MKSSPANHSNLESIRDYELSPETLETCGKWYANQTDPLYSIASLGYLYSETYRIDAIYNLEKDLRCEYDREYHPESKLYAENIEPLESAIKDLEIAEFWAFASPEKLYTLIYKETIKNKLKWNQIKLILQAEDRPIWSALTDNRIGLVLSSPVFDEPGISNILFSPEWGFEVIEDVKTYIELWDEENTFPRNL